MFMNELEENSLKLAFTNKIRIAVLKNWAIKTPLVIAVTSCECVSKPIHVISKIETSLKSMLIIVIIIVIELLANKF